MLLKGKNDLLAAAGISLLLLMGSCGGGGTSAEDKAIADSLRKVKQKVFGDSLKRTNPLLIIPPDSEYTGDYVDRYPSGIVKFKGMFRFGQRHGTWMSFYPSGLKWSEMTYDKGLKEGLNTAYYPNGKIRHTGWFKMDIQDSTWMYFDTAGTMIDGFVLRKGVIVRKLTEEKKP